MLSVILFISYLLLKYLKNVSKILEILFNIKIFFLLKKNKIIFIYLKNSNKILKLKIKITLPFKNIFF